MSGEWLAIKISKAGHWRSGTPDQSMCGKDLKPRPSEKTKSAWAYAEESGVFRGPTAVLRAAARVCTAAPFARGALKALGQLVPPPATRELQAVALLIFAQKGGTTASEITLLSIRRGAISCTVVTDVPQPHVVAVYSHNHRDLATDGEAARKECVSAAIREAYGINRRTDAYTLDELRPLIEDLLRAGLIDDAFVDAATELVRER